MHLVHGEVPVDTLHQSHEAPERVHLIPVHDHQQWGEEVRHALHIAQIEVVHAVGHQQVLEELQIGWLPPGEEGVRAVGSGHILLYQGL